MAERAEHLSARTGEDFTVKDVRRVYKEAGIKKKVLKKQSGGVGSEK